MTFGIYSAKGSPRSIQSVLGKEHCVQTADALWSCAMPIKISIGMTSWIECCKGIARDDDE